MTEFGKINDFRTKENQLEWLKTVVEFLMNADHQEIFQQLEKGDTQKVEIDGERIYAIFQKYASKDGSEPVFEAHRKFIDVQYVHAGSELILVSDKDEANISQVYHEENDCELYTLPNWSDLSMKPGMAAVLYPEDLHAPGIQLRQSELIEKIVVKVCLQQ